MVLQHVCVWRTVESRGDFLRETLQHRCVCILLLLLNLIDCALLSSCLIWVTWCMSCITQALVLEYECTPFPNWKRWIDGRRREACLESMTTLGYWVSDLFTHIQLTLNSLLFIKWCSSLYFYKKCVVVLSKVQFYKIGFINAHPVFMNYCKNVV